MGMGGPRSIPFAKRGCHPGLSVLVLVRFNFVVVRLDSTVFTNAFVGWATAVPVERIAVVSSAFSTKLFTYKRRLAISTIPDTGEVRGVEVARRVVQVKIPEYTSLVITWICLVRVDKLLRKSTARKTAALRIGIKTGKLSLQMIFRVGQRIARTVDVGGSLEPLQ